jgi:hypothetical protein
MKGRRGQVSILQLAMVVVLGAIVSFAMLPHLNSNGQKQVEVVKTAAEKSAEKMSAAVGITTPGKQPPAQPR